PGGGRLRLPARRPAEPGRLGGHGGLWLPARPPGGAPRREPGRPGPGALRPRPPPAPGPRPPPHAGKPRGLPVAGRALLLPRRRAGPGQPPASRAPPRPGPHRPFLAQVQLLAARRPRARRRRGRLPTPTRRTLPAPGRTGGRPARLGPRP